MKVIGKTDRKSIKQDRTPLKKCPFCGSRTRTHLNSNGVRFFDCGGCGASVVFYDEYGTEMSNSVKLFNARYTEVTE